jgi:hypothetical protein
MPANYVYFAWGGRKGGGDFLVDVTEAAFD